VYAVVGAFGLVGDRQQAIILAVLGFIALVVVGLVLVNAMPNRPVFRLLAAGIGLGTSLAATIFLPMLGDAYGFSGELALGIWIAATLAIFWGPGLVHRLLRERTRAPPSP